MWFCPIIYLEIHYGSKKCNLHVNWEVIWNVRTFVRDTFTTRGPLQIQNKCIATAPSTGLITNIDNLKNEDKNDKKEDGSAIPWVE